MLETDLERERERPNLERETWSGRASDGFEVIFVNLPSSMVICLGSLCRLLVFDLLISRTTILIIVMYFLVVLVGVIFGFWGLLWNFLPLSIISSLRDFCEPSSLCQKQASSTNSPNKSPNSNQWQLSCSLQPLTQSIIGISFSLYDLKFKLK